MPSIITLQNTPKPLPPELDDDPADVVDDDDDSALDDAAIAGGAANARTKAITAEIITRRTFMTSLQTLRLRIRLRLQSQPTPTLPVPAPPFANITRIGRRVLNPVNRLPAQSRCRGGGGNAVSFVSDFSQTERPPSRRPSGWTVSSERAQVLTLQALCFGCASERLSIERT